MVSQELSEAYDRLTNRRELYKKATKRGNIIRWLGLIVFILAFVYFFLIFILAIAVPSIGKMSISTWIGGWFGGIAFGLLLMIVGNRITNQKEDLAPFSYHEAAFLRVVDSIKYIETYQKDRIEQSKVEAAKKLFEVKNRIKEPKWENSRLWEELTAESIENMRLLKRNFEERLLPNITQGGDEDLKKAHCILEKFAQYLLNPIVSELKNINESMSELSLYLPEKSRLIPLFEHPHMRHFYILIIFIVSGFLAFRLGISVGASTDTAYTVGIGLFGALTAGYMALMMKKG